MLGMFDVFEKLKGNTNHPGSNDPNSIYFQGGSGNLFADQVNRLQRKSPALSFDNIVMPGADGYMPYQREGMNVFANNLFGKASGDWASRGFVTPQSMNAVVGSALTQAAPNLFAIQNQNQMLPRQLAGMITETRLAPGQFSRGAGTGYNNLNAASSNYWNMMNKIGSAWGSMGTSGAGRGGGGGGFGGV